MIIPCEIASKSVIPAIRAMVARELIEQYGMKQEQVAVRLGVTQAAVSKYQHQVRGEAIQLESAPEVQRMSRDIASMLSKSPSPIAVSQKLCQACTDIRALGLMCETCHKVDPAWDVEHCTICFGNHSCSELVSIEPGSIGKYRRIPIRT
ncbi:MAG TPA: helix-turn-helix domain-containing protein [Candidatus Bathyarchaeia archaeon]